MRHDQFWKTIIRIFLREFMELFFPKEASFLDFSNVRDVERQLFTDLPQGRMREPDLALEVRTMDDDANVIIIHIEIERRRGGAIPRRMWEYYSLLRLRTKHMILPIVLYLGRGAGGIVPETYVESVLDWEILLFRYMSIGLGDLSAEDFAEKENILAAPMSALMHGEQTDRIDRKIRACERLHKTDLDDARKSMLLYMIDTYLPLSEAEEAEMSGRLKDREDTESQEWLSSYELRGREKGKLEGKLEGMLEGRRVNLILLLTHKFGPIPSSVKERIAEIDNQDILDSLIVKTMDATSLDDLGLPNT